MQDSRFWRFIAALCCLGLFYVGSGLHNNGSRIEPSILNLNSASAGGTSLWESSGKDVVRIFTTDETGSHLHVWEMNPRKLSDKAKPTQRLGDVGIADAVSGGGTAKPRGGPGLVDGIASQFPAPGPAMPTYVGTVDIPVPMHVPTKPYSRPK